MAPEPISVERPRHKKNGGRDNLVMRETEMGNSATDNLHHVEESLLPGRSLLHQLGVGLDEVQEHAAEGSLEQNKSYKSIKISSPHLDHDDDEARGYLPDAGDHTHRGHADGCQGSVEHRG